MQDYMPDIPVITMTRTPGRISRAAAGRVKVDYVDVDVDEKPEDQRTQSRTNNVKQSRKKTK